MCVKYAVRCFKYLMIAVCIYFKFKFKLKFVLKYACEFSQ